MRIGLVTDSAGDLPASYVEQFGIEVVPLEVRLGSEVFRDGVDLGTQDMFARVRQQGVFPKTSQPPVGAFIETYQRMLQKYESIISIHISSTLSGTYETARMAQRSFPEADIRIIDSRNVSLAEGLQVLRAARALEAGQSKEEVLDFLEANRRRAELYTVLNTLEYLQRGGRIAGVSAFLGSLLQIKPLVRVADGQVLPVVKSRSRDQAISAMFQRVDPLIAGCRVIVGVEHTCAPEAAEGLRQRLADLYPAVELIRAEAGPVLGTHAGPEAVGIIVVPA